MSEFNQDAPNLPNPEALAEYLGDLPRFLEAEEVDFIEKARWMLEEWEASDDADKAIDPELRKILETNNPDWEESHKRLMRDRLHDASHIAIAIDVARSLLFMPSDERIDAVLELERSLSETTMDYLDLVTQIIISKKQQEAGLPGSVTEVVESTLAHEDRLRAVWEKYLPVYNAHILKTDNNDPTNFSFVFKGKEGAEDLIADFSYDLAEGTLALATWNGNAKFDFTGLTDVIKEDDVTRAEPVELDDFQRLLIYAQKATYEWYAHYHGHLMNSQDTVKTSLGIEHDEDYEGLHDDLSLDVQRLHFNNFIAGSERLYANFR